MIVVNDDLDVFSLLPPSDVDICWESPPTRQFHRCDVNVEWVGPIFW